MKGRNTVLSWYNGASYDVIAKVYSIQGGARDKEVVQDDDLLDSDTNRLAEAGSKFFEDLTIEIQWNPEDADAENHNLLDTAYEDETESFVKIKYSHASGAGEIYHAFVKSVGNAEVLPNNHVRRRVVFTPTGRGYVKQENIDAAANPVV